MPICWDKGFVALPRGLTEWEWYEDANTTRLYIHLLLTANWTTTQWRGITVQPGQKVTSLGPPGPGDRAIGAKCANSPKSSDGDKLPDNPKHP